MQSNVQVLYGVISMPSDLPSLLDGTGPNMYEISLLLLLVLLVISLKGKHPTDAVSLVCLREA
jgi:hypothetical protein